jgi:hypothetical protein
VVRVDDGTRTRDFQIHRRALVVAEKPGKGYEYRVYPPFPPFSTLLTDSQESPRILGIPVSQKR